MDEQAKYYFEYITSKSYTKPENLEMLLFCHEISWKLSQNDDLTIRRIVSDIRHRIV